MIRRASVFDPVDWSEAALGAPSSCGSARSEQPLFPDLDWREPRSAVAEECGCAAQPCGTAAGGSADARKQVPRAVAAGVLRSLLPGAAPEAAVARVMELPGQLRRLGLVPHPYGEEHDERFGATLARLLQKRVDAAAAGSETESGGAGQASMAKDVQAPEANGLAAPADDDASRAQGFDLSDQRIGETGGIGRLVTAGSTTLAGEETGQRCASLGLNNLHLFSVLEEKRYGETWDIFADAMDAGCGILRHVNGAELEWAEIYPAVSVDDDPPIPPPANILDRIVNGGTFTDLSRFTALFLACGVAGVRVVPTLFTRGGGAKINKVEREGLEDYTDALNGRRGKPKHEARAIVPTVPGWDGFYYDPGEIGFESSDPQEEVYQRFALNVYADGQFDYDMRTYAKECARRKALGIAAFATAIGEYAAILDSLSRSLFGGPITTVIPWFEIGNEMEGLWLVDRSDDLLYEGAREYGLFYALLASPIALACPAAKFAAAGLVSTPSDESWERKFTWLSVALTTGVSEPLSRFNGMWSEIECVARAGEFDDTCFTYGSSPQLGSVDATWINTCVSAGFFFPPADAQLSLAVGSLVHQVGFHWYNHWTDTTCGAAGYVPQSQLARVCDWFVEDVVSVLAREHGTAVTWVVSEVGFPAVKLPEELRGDCVEGVHWNELASPAVQAGMLARNVLTILAKGAGVVFWHPHMSLIASTEGEKGWTLFGSMGLRNDVSARPPSFDRTDDAWRRPSWYTYRRLSWLVRRSSVIKLLHAEGNETLIRLRARSGFSVRSDGVRRSLGYAFVGWLDQEASSADTFEFELSTAGRYVTTVSLVPEVWMPATLTVDANGYPGGDFPDWEWDGWSATVSVRTGMFGSGTQVECSRVTEADPALVCIFTDSAMYGV